MKLLITTFFTLLLMGFAGGSYGQSFEETKRLAEQGDATAQKNLGRMYADGDGVPMNTADAIKWYRQSGEQGNKDALAMLGELYERGENGVPRNIAEAIKWYRPSAEQGNLFAQTRLGEMYLYGLDVPENVAEAAKWYRLLAEQGNLPGQNKLGEILSKKIKRGSVTENDGEAVKWYRSAAEQGYRQAQGNLGFMYAEGDGVPQSNLKAYVWLSVSAAQGDEIAKGNRDIVSDRLTPALLGQAQEIAARCLESYYKDCE